MLQNETEVRRRLVSVPDVFPVVNVYVVQLDEADEITGRLGFSFGNVINS